MTSDQFMLEMELYPYSKDNFELTKLVNQIELQEMALNARDAIKYNDLNEEASAYISETVEAANLKVEYFSEGKKKEDGFFKKLWANIVKFWKWIWNNISYIFNYLYRYIGDLLKGDKDVKAMLKEIKANGKEMAPLIYKGNFVESDFPSVLIDGLKDDVGYEGDDIKKLLSMALLGFLQPILITMPINFSIIRSDIYIKSLYKELEAVSDKQTINISERQLVKFKKIATKMNKYIQINDDSKEISIKVLLVQLESIRSNSKKLSDISKQMASRSDQLNGMNSDIISEFNKLLRAIHVDMTKYSAMIVKEFDSLINYIKLCQNTSYDVLRYLKK